MSADISIIICTRNRADSLHQTLCSLATIDVPESVCGELIVVDNGSTDNTQAVLKKHNFQNLTWRYVTENRTGLCCARNTGLAVSEGSVILMTDDDVRPPVGWIKDMCIPILTGQADAVAGGVEIPQKLQRPWMTANHRQALTSTELINPDKPEMFGANMAFARQVLVKVPQFDEELDVGFTGLGGDTLFSYQLIKAGFRLLAALEVKVEHHFDVNRLSRDGYAKRAKALGKTTAYMQYHWEHRLIAWPMLRLIKAIWRLRHLQLKYLKQWPYDEGMPLWEMSAISGIQYYRQYLVERKRPFNYERFGLVKLPYTNGF